ncbi:MAG: serine/threonine protein kinase [Bradymonadia bacterium]|jgi:serine/threonine protein kinase
MSGSSQRYEVIERLDAGGMAEVFRSRAISIEGFEKQVAIKRVLPHLARNQKFVNMFLDEAKLSLYLDHANIVSVFDIGRAGETYFIVMEFVHGANLKRILEWFREKEEHLPIEVCAYIAIEVCKGLEYAHRKQAPDGSALGIVHRDVSPPNILLSREGEVKITDFGLAKAQSQIEVTDPGVVKGKFGYLSPEAAQGETVDQKTDIFAVGIVLWELLSGQRLFLGENDVETLQQVRKAEIPRLRDFQPGVPRELEDIARRALERDPARRFDTAREMGTAITKFLARHGLAVTSYDMAGVIRRIGDNTDAAEPEHQKVMATVIQDEINKLIRIDADAAARDENSGPLEDPRTWADVGFDMNDVSSSHYATRGSTSAPVEAVAMRVVSNMVRVGQTAPGHGSMGPNTPAPAALPSAPSMLAENQQVSGSTDVAYSGNAAAASFGAGSSAPPVRSSSVTVAPIAGRAPGIQDASGLRRKPPRRIVVDDSADVAARASKRRTTLLLALVVVALGAFAAYVAVNGGL